MRGPLVNTIIGSIAGTLPDKHVCLVGLCLFGCVLCVKIVQKTLSAFVPFQNLGGVRKLHYSGVAYNKHSV